MFGLNKRKKQRQYIEGLTLLEEGIKVRLRQCEWRLGLKDLTEEERTRCEMMKKCWESVLKDISDIWDGKLHY